jgi:hypothetical protein
MIPQQLDITVHGKPTTYKMCTQQIYTETKNWSVH